MRIAVAQMCSGFDPQANAIWVDAAIAEAKRGGAKVGRVPLEDLGQPNDLLMRLNGHPTSVYKGPRRHVKLFVNVVGVIHSNRWTRAGSAEKYCGMKRTASARCLTMATPITMYTMPQASAC